MDDNQDILQLILAELKKQTAFLQTLAAYLNNGVTK